MGQINKKIRVRLISKMNKIISRQISKEISDRIEFVFGDDECDYCFVFDEFKNRQYIKCPYRNLIYCCGEPKTVKSYPKYFTHQFGRIAAHYKFRNIENIPVKVPLLPWTVGIKYDFASKSWNYESFLNINDLRNDTLTSNKEDKIAIITSNKAFSRGHRNRIRFVESLKKILGDRMDIYGDGYSQIADKMDVLKHYKYALAIENSHFDNYWTEKLADAFLCNCYPFYNGAPNIFEFFPKESMSVISMDNVKVAAETIIRMLSEDVYSNKMEAIRKAKSLVLNEYNMISLIGNFVLEDYKIELKADQHIVEPLHLKTLDKIKVKINRLIFP